MATSKTNSYIAEGFETVCSELQHFVGHRLEQDLLLWQKVAKSTTLQDIVSAYADFWMKLIADYWQEYATPAKLFAGFTGKVMSQTQTASLEAGQGSRLTTRHVSAVGGAPHFFPRSA
jgi:hypothetical protein